MIAACVSGGQVVNSAPPTPDVDEPSDPIGGREHWAFRPLIRPPQPRVERGDWVRGPIDSFVLAKLETAQLAPSGNAERHTLARRAYFQLTGLPPTTQQVADFVNDSRPDAYERMIDELLNSPRFGERWRRHWLDLARYADSNGLDENFLFREAWRYRNWVIGALNADMPYDRFVAQQIAGDLLPYDSIAERDRQRIASGFLVVGPKVLLGVDVKKQRMDVADEQIDTVGRAILGQTLGCARCHDHKFDPIPTADYYALAGIFTSTSVMQSRHMLGQQRVMERLAGLGAEGDQANAAYETYWREKPKVEAKAKRAKKAFDLLVIPNLVNQTLMPAQQRRQLDLIQSLNKRHLDRVEVDPRIEGLIASYELAFRMQSEVPQIMTLADESKSTLDMYGIGAEPTDNFGRQCLLARKFAEQGVRYIQVSTDYTWDHHTKVKEGHVAESAKVDRPISGLLEDLARRGLLDDTLVVWGAEFGRTPMVENGDGRGHHPQVFTMWMAGGGARGGLTHGTTDEYGYGPVENPVHMHDLHATLLHALGLDHEQLTYRYAGRDFRLTDVHGDVVHDILV